MSILLSEFGDFVEWRFGKEHQEQSVKVANAVNDMQKVKWELGYGDIKNYEYIPEIRTKVRRAHLHMQRLPAFLCLQQMRRICNR